MSVIRALNIRNRAIGELENLIINPDAGQIRRQHYAATLREVARMLVSAAADLMDGTENAPGRGLAAPPEAPNE